MTKVKINCVQPIKISENLYNKLLLRKSDFVLSALFNDDFSISWIRKFVGEYYKFKSFRCLNCIDNIHSAQLSKEILSNRYSLEEKSFGQYLVEDETLVDVVFDERFWSFVIVYEFSFDIPEMELRHFLQLNTEVTSFDDFYNQIRNLVVNSEDNNDGVSLWGNTIRNKVVTNIENIICDSLSIDKEAYKNASEFSVEIRRNTGNFTFYVIDSAQNENLKRALIRCNKGAEKTIKSPVDINIGGQSYYGFYGRFHTVMTESSTNIDRYALIQYHMQYMWFQLGIISEALTNLNSVIRDLTIDTKHHDEQEALIDEYINLISHLIIHNENIKLTIESDKAAIYSVIEKVWNIESSIENSKMYVEFFKEYCHRIFTRKLAKSAKRQNKILFGISILQIVALLSVWNDYLDFSSKNLTDSYLIFSQAALPILLLLIVIVLFISAWKGK
ncbi:hypothetical protein [Cognaticolwellia mytili]|uniref:hypothetical protein n=1 Tax=Cognaticolwellia mytili TaxID=1888913 RepID=UPI000A1708C3|nr:hypothetical protein [Cognaticolwellia mytili]